MKFTCRLNKTDPYMVEFYDDYGDGNYLACVIHIDILESFSEKAVEALTNGESIVVKLKYVKTLPGRRWRDEYVETAAD